MVSHSSRRWLRKPQAGPSKRRALPPAPVEKRQRRFDDFQHFPDEQDADRIRFLWEDKCGCLLGDLDRRLLPNTAAGKYGVAHRQLSKRLCGDRVVMTFLIMPKQCIARRRSSKLKAKRQSKAAHFTH